MREMGRDERRERKEGRERGLKYSYFYFWVTWWCMRVIFIFKVEDPNYFLFKGVILQSLISLCHNCVYLYICLLSMNHNLHLFIP